eukprot:51497-Chlamydomonas_euryale.AAC.4
MQFVESDRCLRMVTTSRHTSKNMHHVMCHQTFRSCCNAPRSSLRVRGAAMCKSKCMHVA